MLNVVFGFCIGSVEDSLASGTGNPVAQVLFNVGGKSGGLAMWFWIILIQFFTGKAATHMVSEQGLTLLKVAPQCWRILEWHTPLRVTMPFRPPSQYCRTIPHCVC